MADEFFSRTKKNAGRGGFDAAKSVWDTFGTTGSPSYKAQGDGGLPPVRAFNAVLGDALLMALSGASGVAAGGAGLIGDAAAGLGMDPNSANRLSRDLGAMATELPWTEFAMPAAGGLAAAQRGMPTPMSAFGDTVSGLVPKADIPGFMADEAGHIPTRWLTPADRDYTPVPLRFDDGNTGSGLWDTNQIMQPVAEPPVGRMDLPGQLSFDEAIAPPPPPPPPPRASRRGLFYSQAEQSLVDNPQAKGTVGQFRQNMLKAGVKPDELFWSGFDSQFADPNQKITKDELIGFFQKAPDPLTRKRYQASGITGEDIYDDEDAFQSFIENERHSGEVEDSVVSGLASDLRRQGTTVGDLRESDPDTYAQLLEDYDPEDLADDSLFYEGEVITDPEDYVRNFMSDDVSFETERQIETAWNNWGRADAGAYRGDALDPGDTTYSSYFTPGGLSYREDLYQVNPEIRDRAFGGYTGKSLYQAPHFPQEGGRDLAVHARSAEFQTPDRRPVYHVNEVQSDYAQENRGPNNKDRHGDPEPQPSIRKPQTEAELYKLTTEAENLDYSQKLLSDTMADVVGGNTLPWDAYTGLPSAQNRRASGVKEMLLDPELSRYDQQAILEAYARYPEGREVPSMRLARKTDDWAFRDQRVPWDPQVMSHMRLLDARERWAENNNLPQRQLSFADVSPERARSRGAGPEVDENGMIDLAAMEDAEFESLDLDFVPDDNGLFADSGAWPRTRNVYRTPEDIGISSVDERPMGARDPVISEYGRTKALRNSAYASPNPEVEPALPLQYSSQQNELADLFARERETGPRLEEIQGRISDIQAGDTPEHKKQGLGTVPAAPFVTNTDKWTDQALRRSLADALGAVPENRGSRFQYMSLGTPEQAQKMTFMPQKAAEKFYGSMVPARMQKLLDQVAPGHRMEKITIETGEGDTEVYAVRLTDQLRDAIEKNGIPFYSVGGGMVVLGAQGAEDQAPAPQGGGGGT